MKIDALQVYHVSMPLVYPFRTAFGNDAAVESVIVRLQSGEQIGWGEAAPWKFPAYCPESASGAFLVIRDFLAPLIVGQEVESGEALQQQFAGIKGNHFAKAAVDLAWWDLHSSAKGLPLYQALGGKRTTVDVGADFGIMESIDLLLKTIDEAVQQGFKRVKLKYRPGWDLAMVDAVRKAFPKTTFHVDCNSAYTLNDLEMFKKLDRYELAMIEQPLMHDDLIDHAELQKHLRTPICLDESITSVDRARKAIQCKAAGWINIKPGRVGGLTNAVRIHDVCADAGVPCWVGGMLESSVGGSHCLALASLPNFKYPSDIFPTQRFYHQDLSEPEMVMSGPSVFNVRTTPGLGAKPHPERLAKNTLQKAEIAKPS